MRWTSPFLRVINRCTRTAKRVLCVTKERKREREVSTSLFFFFFERISFGFVGVSPNEKAPICKSNDFGIVLIKGVCKILSSEFPEEEKKGNNIESVISVLNEAKTHLFKNLPVVILLHTEMGNGVDFMMGTHKWHGSAPNDDQLALALSQNKETLGDY